LQKCDILILKTETNCKCEISGLGFIPTEYARIPEKRRHLSTTSPLSYARGFDFFRLYSRH
jgi:hypothetical protein